jgi:hypothetical protein
MTQKPVLRADVYARALRASQNRKENSEGRKHNTSIPSKVEAVHEIILKPDLALDDVCGYSQHHKNSAGASGVPIKLIVE